MPNISAQQTLSINYLNAQGIGIAENDQHDIEVPFSLPGEVVVAEVYHKSRTLKVARITEIIQAHNARIDPPCKHFGVCGGCTLQHCTPSFHNHFKLDKLLGYLKDNHVHCKVIDEVISVAPGKRRRIDFMGKKIEGATVLGFHQRLNKRRFNTQVCPVIHPDLEALFNPLRDILNQVLAERELIHVFATRADNGIDLLLAGLRRPLESKDVDLLLQLTTRLNITRLTYKIKTHAHEIYVKEVPYITLAGYKVGISPYCFLQASQASDTILAQCITQAIPLPAQKIADLFCGRGTLTLPLIQTGHCVDGFECDAPALSELNKLELMHLTTQLRNLFDDPLTLDELARYDVIVINPPRSGALDQIKQLGLANHIHTVVYVSCNPETFARDAKVLQDSRYILQKIIPIDQFIWSGHLEVIGVFKR